MRLVRRLGHSGLNLAKSSGGELATRALGLVYLVVLARYLGPTGFGEFNALLAYYGLAVVVGSIGLDRLALRDLARGDRPRRLFSTLLTMRVAAAVITGAILVLSGFVLEGPEVAHLAVLAVALIPAGVASMYTAEFQAHHEFGPPAVAAVAGTTVMVAVALGAVAVGGTLTLLLWAVVASDAVRAGFLVVQGRDRRPAAGAGVDWQLAGEAVREAALYWTLAVLAMVYFRIDLVMLDLMRGGEQVGQYASAYRIFEVLSLAPVLITGVLFPRFARLQVSDRGRARALYLRAVPVMVWLGLGVSAAVAVLAGPLLTLLFSSAYLDAVASLHWLMLALVLFWWHATNATILLSGDEIGVVAALSTLTAGFNVVVNLVAIPRYGAAGAAAVTAASELLSLVLFTPLVCRRLEIPLKTYIRNLLTPRLSSDDLDLLLDRTAETPDPGGPS